jgi:hypothetical protein
MPRLNPRRALLISMLLLAVAAASANSYTGAGRPDPERTNPPAPDRWMMLQTPEDLLEARRVALCHRSEVRRRIARDVFSQRMTLLEAACWCRDLNETNPEFCWADFRVNFPGATDDERHARYVIAWVRAEFPNGSAEGTAVVASLEAELAERLRQGALGMPW